MPEAVIVATARSPIGRAFKGSLTSIRPDDLTAQLVSAALAKVPQLRPDDIDDLMLGCGLPGGEQGFNMAPVQASRQALSRAGMTIDDMDLVEINEAFAAQVIPSYTDLGIDIDKLNVNGGAIAVGHPFGMTGARITTTLVNSLQFHDKTYGLETMCVGGGQGMAMLVERLS